MSTLTVYSNNTDGRLLSTNADYATARAGGTISAPDNSANQAYCGQYCPGSSYLSVVGLQFDTSQIGAGQTLASAALSVAIQENDSAGPWTLEARAWNWTPPLASQWVPGANLAGYTLLASRTMGAGDSLNTYYALTSQAALLAAINPTGITSLILVSASLTSGAQDNNFDAFYMRDSGTTYAPKLVVTYSPNPLPTPAAPVVSASQSSNLIVVSWT